MSAPQPVTALVLAAGSSRRLGQPKQLLPYRGKTLLDATLSVVRSVPVAQRIVTVGGAADQVRESVDLDGFEVVVSQQHSQGCSSSIVSALDTVGPSSRGIMLLLGDQPHVQPEAIHLLVEAGLAGHDLAVCRYADGIGHPFWFGRALFGELAALGGDKAVWKLIESGRHPVHEVVVPGTIPADVDTWDDYENLLSLDAAPAIAATC